MEIQVCPHLEKREKLRSSPLGRHYKWQLLSCLDPGWGRARGTHRGEGEGQRRPSAAEPSAWPRPWPVAGSSVPAVRPGRASGLLPPGRWPARAPASPCPHPVPPPGRRWPRPRRPGRPVPAYPLPGLQQVPPGAGSSRCRGSTPRARTDPLRQARPPGTRRASPRGQ